MTIEGQVVTIIALIEEQNKALECSVGMDAVECYKRIGRLEVEMFAVARNINESDPVGVIEKAREEYRKTFSMFKVTVRKLHSGGDDAWDHEHTKIVYAESTYDAMRLVMNSYKARASGKRDE